MQNRSFHVVAKAWASARKTKKKHEKTATTKTNEQTHPHTQKPFVQRVQNCCFSSESMQSHHLFTNSYSIYRQIKVVLHVQHASWRVHLCSVSRSHRFYLNSPLRKFGNIIITKDSSFSSTYASKGTLTLRIASSTYLPAVNHSCLWRLLWRLIKDTWVNWIVLMLTSLQFKKETHVNGSGSWARTPVKKETSSKK
mgnify:CR=1 FL=1